MFDADDRNYREGEFSARVAALKNNAPHMLPNVDLSANEKRAALEEMGVSLPVGTFLRDIPLAGVPVEFSEHVTLVGQKLTCGLYYKHRGTALPLGWSMFVNWTQLQNPGADALAEAIQKYLPSVHVGGRRNTDIGEQFAYAWAYNDQESLFAFGAQFGRGLVLLCAATPADTASGSRHPDDWFPHQGPPRRS